MLLRRDALKVNDFFFSVMILESNPTDYLLFLFIPECSFKSISGK